MRKKRCWTKEKDIPNRAGFQKGLKRFRYYEKREAMYNIATFLLEEFWGKPAKMADSLGVLLLTWNQALYRYGEFDFNKLEQCIEDNLETIESFRKREIFSFTSADEAKIKKVAEVVKDYPDLPGDKTLVKLIDEYNYSKHTKHWI